MAKQKTIAIFTSSEGHLSIAQAIEETLKAAGYKVVVFFEKNELFNLYIPIYQYVPAVYKLPFTITKFSRARKIIVDYFEKKFRKTLERFFAKHKPDLMISTYYMYNPTLVRLAQLTDTPFINVVTDPNTIHPLIVSPQADSNLVFDQNSKTEVQKYFPKVKTKISGWFVRDRFEQDYDQQKIRRKLKLKPNLLTVLIASGSEGTNMILKILPTMLFSPKQLQIVVACGNNKTLLRGVETLKRIAKSTANQNQIVGLTFTPHIDEYMKAADLVVGKAGPNTLFETTATKTAFFAITHISGQEDGNLDIIRNNNLGIVEENPMRAQQLLRGIIAQPEDLEKFSPHIKKMAEKNHLAKDKLLKLVKSLLEK
jgi:UDP-N-acetylglucosamine:LPS N-acetylglucosamine transferase